MEFMLVSCEVLQIVSLLEFYYDFFIVCAAPEEVKPEEAKPVKVPTKKEGMVKVGSLLEWDLAAVLAFFIASCYIVCFWMI